MIMSFNNLFNGSRNKDYHFNQVEKRATQAKEEQT